MKAKWAICLGVSITFILCSLCIPGRIDARCNDTDTKIVATYPNLFESKTWCDQTRLIDDLQTGAGRFGITNVRFHYSDELIDNPPTVEDLISKVQNGGPTKTFIANTHMNQNEIAVAYYATEAARNAAYSALLSSDSAFANEIRLLDGEEQPAPGLGMLGTGISSRIASYLSSSAMVLAIGCNSTGLRSYFGTFSDPGDYTGNTFMGLDYVCSMDSGCDIVEDVIWGLGCFGFPVRGHELDDAMGSHYWTTLVTVTGNVKNSFSCYKSCWDWSVNFIFAGVDPATSQAVWGVEHEDRMSYYELRGYAYPGAAPEVLDTAPGFGTDGSGHLRIHAVPLPDGYAEYDVVEYDDDRFISISPRFSASDPIPPEFQSFEPGNDYDLEMINQGPKKKKLSVYGGKDLETLEETIKSSDPRQVAFGQSELTGHAIVFAFDPGAVWRVFQHLEEHYPTADGSPAEIVWFFTYGVPDPSEITSMVNLVRSNNQAAGGYPENPDLQIVGDEGWATWPDDEDWSQDNSLSGFRPIYPQGSIGVIPTLDDADIERYLIAAEEYIDGQSVFNDAVLFVSDALNDTSAAWMREDVQHFAQAFPSGVNVNFLYESDFSTSDLEGMRTASYTAINNGVGWVFTQGFHFHVHLLTYFVRGANWDPLQLTTVQRNVWVNFGCYATNTSYPYTHQCKRILFNQLDRAVGVGFFGPLVDGHGIVHIRAREVFLDEMVKASGEEAEITLAQFGHRFQDALIESIPEYDWYAEGWTFYGSIAIPYRGGPVSTAVRGIGGQTPRAIELIARKNPSDTSFPLAVQLEEATDMSLDVYDVAGRRVATVVRGHYSPGGYVWEWNPGDRLASGVYFAVLSTQQERRTAKLVLVR